MEASGSFNSYPIHLRLGRRMFMFLPKLKIDSLFYWWLEIVLVSPLFLFWPSVLLYLLWKRVAPGGSPFLFKAFFYHRPWLAVLFAVICPFIATALSLMQLRAGKRIEGIGFLLDILIILAGITSLGLMTVQIIV